MHHNGILVALQHIHPISCAR